MPALLPPLLDAAVRLELAALQSAVARALEDNLSAETCLLAWEAQTMIGTPPGLVGPRPAAYGRPC